MLLKIENLSVNYGYVKAVRNADIEVNEGEIVTLIGGNGAGKTSTLMAISGLAEKTSGKITFKDRDITTMEPNRIVNLGIAHVPEGRMIFPSLTVYENLMAGTIGNPRLTKQMKAKLLEENYELFPRLKERSNQAGGSLSGGEQQMLAIARGMMLDPDMIMLDEPSLGLAPILVEEIFQMILKIREHKKTVLLIEQNAAMALSIADRGYVLENGVITITGTGKELISNENVKKAYLGI